MGICRIQSSVRHSDSVVSNKKRLSTSSESGSDEHSIVPSKRKKSFDPVSFQDFLVETVTKSVAEAQDKFTVVRDSAPVPAPVTLAPVNTIPVPVPTTGVAGRFGRFRVGLSVQFRFSRLFTVVQFWGGDVY